MRSHAGVFIAIEGIDGAGKTTQARMLVSWLRAEGMDVLLTREPGGTALGESLRESLLRFPVDAVTESLLYSAARANLVRQVIRPAINGGTVVLTDRWLPSSYAYQGGGRGLPLPWLEAVSRVAVDGLEPDITFLLWLPPEEALARTKGRYGAPRDRFELEELAFYRRVAETYAQLAKASPARCVVVDATRRVDAVQETLREELRRRLLFG